MFRNNVLCDVVLEAADVEIPVHKLVMASGSPYFMAMFTGKRQTCLVASLKSFEYSLDYFVGKWLLIVIIADYHSLKSSLDLL